MRSGCEWQPPALTSSVCKAAQCSGPCLGARADGTGLSVEGVEGIIAGSAIGLVSGVLAAVLLAHVLMRTGAAGRPGRAATTAAGAAAAAAGGSAPGKARPGASCPHAGTGLWAGLWRRLHTCVCCTSVHHRRSLTEHSQER